MEDAVHAVQVERLLGEVEPEHVDAGRVPLLLGRVVVVGEAVHPDHLVAGREERLGQVGADEAGRARDDVAH